jgi:hypothetical protein
MHTVTVAVFLALVFAMLALAAVGHARPSLVAPMKTLLDRVLVDRAARISVMLFWWWLAWHFLVARTVDTVPAGLN